MTPRLRSHMMMCADARERFGYSPCKHGYSEGYSVTNPAMQTPVTVTHPGGIGRRETPRVRAETAGE